MIKTADWVVDMGPEGGNGGGSVVAEGTPEEIAAVTASHTGKFLRDILGDFSDASPSSPSSQAAPAKAAKAAATATKAPAKAARTAAKAPAKTAAKAPAKRAAAKK